VEIIGGIGDDLYDVTRFSRSRAHRKKMSRPSLFTWSASSWNRFAATLDFHEFEVQATPFELGTTKISACLHEEWSCCLLCLKYGRIFPGISVGDPRARSSHQNKSRTNHELTSSLSLSSLLFPTSFLSEPILGTISPGAKHADAVVTFLSLSTTSVCCYHFIIDTP